MSRQKLRSPLEVNVGFAKPVQMELELEDPNSLPNIARRNLELALVRLEQADDLIQKAQDLLASNPSARKFENVLSRRNQLFEAAQSLLNKTTESEHGN